MNWPNLMRKFSFTDYFKSKKIASSKKSDEANVWPSSGSERGWEQVGLHYMTHAVPQGRYLALGLTWSRLNFCGNRHQQRWVWEPSPEWIFWSSSTTEQYRMKGSALAQVQEKKEIKKQKGRTACLAERSKTTHPSAPPLCQINTAASKGPRAAQHRAAAHTLPTNHRWDVYGQNTVPSRGWRAPLPHSGWWGLHHVLSSGEKPSQHSTLRTVVLGKVKKNNNKKGIFSFSPASTIFKWFHFTILPWAVPNKRFTKS